MPTFELNFSTPQQQQLPDSPELDSLANTLLLQNARWFTQIRWMVVLLFVLTGLACNAFPTFLENLGFVPPQSWPWVLAANLALANSLFSLLLAGLNEESPYRQITFHIWLQIVVDLLVLTVLVHLVGSTETLISFTYLFHIVLACIFFPPRSSFLVLLLAGSLFVSCLGLEIAQFLPSAGLIANLPISLSELNSSEAIRIKIIFGGSALSIWTIVWYLTASLSSALRRRDRMLDNANRQLIKADHEKTRIMLSTTHELKSPFAGIEMKIQELRLVHWNEFSEQVRSIINSIETRSRVLRERVNDIILLGNLRAHTARQDNFAPADLQNIFAQVLQNVSDRAMEREVTIRLDITPLKVMDKNSQLAILFSNLLTNAIAYSNKGGSVEIGAREDGSKVVVSVTDHGIGIEPENMPRIFDEYFRTKSAEQFNKYSSGLGLSIVREIVRRLALSLRVTSHLGKGTTFEVTLAGA